MTDKYDEALSTLDELYNFAACADLRMGESDEVEKAHKTIQAQLLEGQRVAGALEKAIKELGSWRSKRCPPGCIVWTDTCLAEQRKDMALDYEVCEACWRNFLAQPASGTEASKEAEAANR